MAIEKAIASLVLADQKINSLIGDRFYPVGVPQEDPLPAATYQLISSVREHTMDGPDGLVEARIQINAWAATYVDAFDLANGLRLCLDGIGDTTVEGTYISTVGLLDAADEPVIMPEDRSQDAYGRRLDFTVWFKE